jgi:hypothetical protein
MKNIIYSIFIFLPLLSIAQFEPQVGQTGTTAIFKDSSAFKSWAKSCKLFRGYQNIANPSAGYASIGDENAPLGKAGTNGVVSLGDAGVAILTFESPIANGEGFDFAVFENGFKEIGGSFDFLEFAFVEVSSDGIRFVRFPSEYKGQTTTQVGSFEPIDTRLYHNLAGKYTAGYGTPFDLDELKDSIGLDINNITHVKIVDVIGSIDPLTGSKDSKGNIVNETYPTEFPSSGFDLDAVGAINLTEPTGILATNQKSVFSIYPNPSHDFIEIKAFNLAISNLEITDMGGLVLKSWTSVENTKLDISKIQAGSYLLKVNTTNGTFAQKLIVN